MKLNKFLKFRISEDDLKEVTEDAEVKDKTVSQYCRERILDRIEDDKNKQVL